MSSIDHLVIEHLSKRIGDVPILQDISLEVKSGEVFGIFGPDGAGKSSLLKIIAGIWEPSAGHLSLNGSSFTKTPPQLREKMGYMAFEEGLYEDLTATENLEYSANLYNLSFKRSFSRIEWLLKKTDLWDFRNLSVGKFSGGMKQKLSLCCALLHRPQILLLDEPSTGIDPLSRRAFWNLLFDLPEEGAAILLTTPYLEEISRCQRVAILYQGRILLSGDPKTLYERSGWKAFDLWPDPLLPAIELFEKQSQVTSYRVRGHSIHLLYPLQESPEMQIVKNLESSGIQIPQYQPSRVEMEDLFLLHLKSMEQDFEEVPAAQIPWLHPEVSRGNEAVIFTENLTKDFGKLAAVKDVSFSIHRGEILGIIGSNGAGKTTLLKMLCGLLAPDAGRVSVLGKDPLRHRSSILDQLSYMSQKFSLYQDLTVEENIHFYAGIFSLPERELSQRTDWILHLTGLQEHVRQRVADLPTSLRQRLALGCTLVHDPSIILLDEPTSGVDPITRRYLWHWISVLAEKGRTILVTTHYMNEAEQCHRILLMHHGSLVALGTPQEICAAENQKRALLEMECEPLKPAMEALQGISWIHSAVPFGDRLHVMVPKEFSRFSEIRDLLSKKGVHLEYLSPIPYSVEDVFVEEIRSHR